MAPPKRDNLKSKQNVSEHSHYVLAFYTYIIKYYIDFN